MTRFEPGPAVPPVIGKSATGEAPEASSAAEPSGVAPTPSEASVPALDALEQELAWVGADAGHVQRQAGGHIEAEEPVWVDVPPGQRRQSPPLGRSHPLNPDRLGEDALDHERVDKHHAVLQQVEAQHGRLLVLDTVGGDLAAAAVENEVVGRVPVLHDVQSLV